MMALLEGKVVLVTGAGSGIGRAAAILFAKEGAKVGVLDRDEASGAETAATIAAAAGFAIPLIADVTDEDAVSRAIAQLKKEFGELDGAFNNAGIEMANRLLPDLSGAEWNRMIAINLTGVFSCMKHETRAMAARGAPLSTCRPVTVSSGRHMRLTTLPPSTA